MLKNLTKILKLIVPLALGFYLVWYFFSSMSEESLRFFYVAIKKANYFWIVLALFLSFLTYCLRAYRWKYTLEPLGYKPSFWNRYHSMMIGYLINMTIPRAGEASRAAMLYRSDGVPFSASFGTIIAERTIDLIMLGIVCLISLFIGHENFISIFSQIKERFSDSSNSESFNNIKIILSIVVFIGFCIGLIVLKRKPTLRKKVLEIIKGFISGVLSILKCKNPIAYLTQTVGIWVSYIVYFGIAFLSLEETKNFPIDGIILAFIVGAIGISFTNGGIGAFPLLVAMVVVFYLPGQEANNLAIGNALGMLIWVSQTILVIILGLISVLLLPKNYDKKNVQN
jgi:glycosyltransferase 2 family protein